MLLRDRPDPAETSVVDLRPNEMQRALREVDPHEEGQVADPEATVERLPSLTAAILDFANDKEPTSEPITRDLRLVVSPPDDRVPKRGPCPEEVFAMLLGEQRFGKAKVAHHHCLHRPGRRVPLGVLTRLHQWLGAVDQSPELRQSPCFEVVRNLVAGAANRLCDHVEPRRLATLRGRVLVLSDHHRPWPGAGNAFSGPLRHSMLAGQRTLPVSAEGTRASRGRFLVWRVAHSETVAAPPAHKRERCPGEDEWSVGIGIRRRFHDGAPLGVPLPEQADLAWTDGSIAVPSPATVPRGALRAIPANQSRTRSNTASRLGSDSASISRGEVVAHPRQLARLRTQFRGQALQLVALGNHLADGRGADRALDGIARGEVVEHGPAYLGPEGVADRVAQILRLAVAADQPGGLQPGHAVVCLVVKHHASDDIRELLQDEDVSPEVLFERWVPWWAVAGAVAVGLAGALGTDVGLVLGVLGTVIALAVAADARRSANEMTALLARAERITLHERIGKVHTPIVRLLQTFLQGGLVSEAKGLEQAGKLAGADELVRGRTRPFLERLEDGLALHPEERFPAAWQLKDQLWHVQIGLDGADALDAIQALASRALVEIEKFSKEHPGDDGDGLR